MKTSLLLFSILFCCSLIVFAQKDSLKSEKIQSDEYQVYKAVLKEMFIKPVTKQIVIRNLTSDMKYGSLSAKTILMELGRENIPVLPETIEDYQSKQQKFVELKNEFGIDIPVNLVTNQEINPILNKWQENLSSNNPDKAYREIMTQKYETTTVITFSNIGFNKEKNQALLSVLQYCGSLCGSSHYLFLIKEDNNWTIKKRMLTSNS